MVNQITTQTSAATIWFLGSVFFLQFEARLLGAYNSIIQNLARTAFMAIGMTFIASFSRIHSIIKHLQIHQNTLPYPTQS
ncbi:hypothetical protein Pst134EA_017115 [Puccinia striiformis f. sp. tritici]|uniref:hypothetical protein n=1 Tax=Puccinia striiformis f. sp. tritici TaxID=168172 RepID=UPI002007591D|nr:hypothetical protein Pst134EA_017115 [Puccinia striiformis f. sp. tritici]KAH9460799.1 hypothetical protein Pst134EA_017115 [Puccinia striiformis f. sp. tritici]